MDVNAMYQHLTNIAGNVAGDVVKASITRTFQAVAEAEELRKANQDLTAKLAGMQKHLDAANDTIKQLSEAALRPPG